MKKDTNKQIQTTLFITEISPQVQIQELEQFFSKKHPKIHYQYGSTIATAVFRSHQNALDAYQSLNFKKINNQTIHIYFHDPSTITPGPNTIFLRGLPSTITERDIFEKVKQYGQVLDIRTDIYRSKGSTTTFLRAIIIFANSTSTDKALSSLNNSILNGKTITAKRYKTSSELTQEIVSLSNSIGYIQFPPDYPFLSQYQSNPRLILQTFKNQNCDGCYDAEFINEYLFVFFSNDQYLNHAISVFNDPSSTPPTSNNADLNNNNNENLNNNNNNNTTIQDEIKGIKILTQVRNDIAIKAQLSLEKRWVFIETRDIPPKPDFENYISKIGKVIDIEYRPKQNISSYSSIIIKFSTIEERNICIKHYDRQPPPTLTYPIRVFPYVNFKLQKDSVGVLQINELDLSTTYEFLINKFSEFGTIITATICPVSTYVNAVLLFEHYHSAESAYNFCKSSTSIQHQNNNSNQNQNNNSNQNQNNNSNQNQNNINNDQNNNSNQNNNDQNKYVNVFLYPPMNAQNVFRSFYGSENVPNSSLIIYNLPPKTSEMSLQNEVSPSSHGIFTAVVDNTGLVVFASLQNAELSYMKLRTKYKVELYGVNTIHMLFNQLQHLQLPIEWDGRLIFVRTYSRNLYSDEKEFRKDAQYYGNVESCMMDYLSSENPNGRGLILMENLEDAELLLASKILGNASIFQSRPGYTLNLHPNIAPVYKFPILENNRPRNYLRNFVKLNAEQEKIEKILKLIESLSFEEVFELYSNQDKIIEWYQNQINKD